MVCSLEKSGREAAGKCLLHVAELVGRQRERLAGQSRVDRFAVGPRRGGDIVRTFEPAFDLEADDAGVDQVADEFVARQVLRAEQIGPIAKFADLAIRDQFVWQSARLGTLPAVGTAAAERFAGETLTGVSDAKCPVNEHLDRHARSRRHLAHIGNGQFASQDDAANIEMLAGPLDAPRLGERHLRGCVNVQTGGHSRNEPGQPQVLNDDRIGPGLGDQPNILGDFGKFITEDERVERDEALNVACVQKLEDVRQFFRREVGSPMASIESGEPKVNRIRAVRTSGAESVPVARGGEEVRLKRQYWH